MVVNIVLPVFNEELRIEKGVKVLCDYLGAHPEIDNRITIVDNASTDKTGDIAKRICRENKNITYIYIAEKGVGAAFRCAVLRNKSEMVGYMDIDMSTELSALSIMYEAFHQDRNLQIVNATRYHKRSELIGRKRYRNMISYSLIILLKSLFGMKSTDAICGFKFFKKEVIEELLRESSNETGWFLLIEILLRAEKKKLEILELPVKWTYEKHTKVRTVKVTLNYLKQIFLLKIKFTQEGKNV